MVSAEAVAGHDRRGDARAGGAEGEDCGVEDGGEGAEGEGGECGACGRVEEGGELEKEEEGVEWVGLFRVEYEGGIYRFGMGGSHI